MRKRYERPLRFPELAQELATAGLVPDALAWRGATVADDRAGKGAWAEIDFADAQQAQYDATLAAHDPAAIDASRAAAQQQDAGDRQAARQAVANLTSAIDGWATLTAAQKDQAALTSLRCARALIRVLARSGLL
jgi:hypothetical protein